MFSGVLESSAGSNPLGRASASTGTPHLCISIHTFVRLLNTSFSNLDPGKLIVITASAPIRTMSSAFTVICIGFDLSPRKDTPPSALTMIPFPRKESVKYSAIPTVERKASAPAAAISLTNFFGSCNAGNVLKFAAWSIAIINVFPSVLKM